MAGTLVYEVSRRALAAGGIQRLVMAADATYHAARVYTSVGFEPAEKLYAALNQRTASRMWGFGCNRSVLTSRN